MRSLQWKEETIEFNCFSLTSVIDLHGVPNKLLFAKNLLRLLKELIIFLRFKEKETNPSEVQNKIIFSFKLEGYGRL